MKHVLDDVSCRTGEFGFWYWTTEETNCTEM